MKVYRNAAWKRRDYERTNVVACVAAEAPKRNIWELADESALAGLTKLWIDNGIQYYGYL